MAKENLQEVETSHVDASFTQKLEDMTNIQSETTGKAVRRLFVERSGIIRELIAGQIDFTHRTFQEFFAAQAALAATDVQFLVLNAHYDQWREIIILAAGLATHKQCEQLIEGLIQRGDEEKEYQHQLYLLAISCLETAIELKHELRTTLEMRLSQLVPPKNITEAKALTSAGDLAVPFLKFVPQKYNALTNAACIRTLALIGSDLAFDQLEGYLQAPNATAADELYKSSKYFRKKDYVERILSKMKVTAQVSRGLPNVGKPGKVGV